MRRVVLLISHLGPLFSAEGISSAERAYLISHLEMTREFVRSATSGLTTEQWLFKPAPLRWSIAQCVEHIARTEEHVLQTIREQVLKSEQPLLGPYPSTSRGRILPREKPQRMSLLEDAYILRSQTDRTSATARPVEERPPVEEIAPRDLIDDPVPVLEHFFRVRAATIEYLKTSRDDLRGHFTMTILPGFPEVKFHDAYQWILRMSAHTERHLMQIHEVKQTKGYR